MTPAWTPEQLQQIDGSRELDIASKLADGTLRQWLPIRVVCADDQVYIRTWYRRTTGWFGRVVSTQQARIRVPRLETDVVVEDIGDGDADLRSAVDAAYHAKYAPIGGGSVGEMDRI